MRIKSYGLGNTDSISKQKGVFRMNQMYQKTELVFYGSAGVCRITDIAPLPSATKENKLYYTLVPLFSPFAEVVYAPVQANALLRPLLTKAQAQDCMAQFQTLPLLPYQTINHKSAHAFYLEILRSYIPLSYLRLIKTLRHKALYGLPRPKLCQKEQQYLKQAETLLCGELAVVLQTTPAQIRAWLYAQDITPCCVCM